MRRFPLVAIAVLSLALALLASPAVARSSAPSASDDAGQARAAEHRRVAEYWTASRRASAVPRDVMLPLGSKPNPRDKPGSGSGDVLGAPWTQGGSVSVTTGKVFFTSGSSRYVCSGSAVSSSSRSLVLTAGHCAHDGGATGKYVTNWIFYPRYSKGPDPALGAWTASRLVATNDWTSRTHAFENDAAFAKVGNGTSTTLEAALAAQGGAAPGISFTRPSSGSKVHAFGYPAARKYNGASLIYCSGSVTIGYDGRDTQSIPCNMTGGSSGGPWFRGFSSGDAPGTLNSVNSYGYKSVKDRMFGPIFDSQEQSAYNAANA
ncbi:MAG: trypsin-like serine protease [Nitriliruptorales bacterium]|nr:trypsin-like serine protease [Nitriliruptorales bacterium]